MTLAEIRAKLLAQDSNKGGNKGSFSGDNAIYAHWNIAEGSSAKLRFAPDGDTKNSYFWVEKAMIRLPFAGIKGQSDSKTTLVQVPCVEMYNDGSACPILAEVRTWFKDPGMEEQGRKYWKKRSYLMQGFVHANPMADDKAPENPIRRFVISPQIYNLIKAALMDPELENMPTDFESGLDFIVNKTSKGGYSDYGTSVWSRKETALNDAEMAAIDQYGLFDLKSFLPKKPGEVELAILKEMFEASVDGKPYDGDKWGQYYKPSGFKNDNEAAASDENKGTSVRVSVPVRAPAPAPVAVAPAASSPFADTAAEPAPAATAAPAASGKRAEDILAMIRNRNK